LISDFLLNLRRIRAIKLVIFPEGSLRVSLYIPEVKFVSFRDKIMSASAAPEKVFSLLSISLNGCCVDDCSTFPLEFRNYIWV